MTTICYIGNFVPARSTENAYRYAFERLGYTVRTIQQEEAFKSIESRGTWLGMIDGADLILYTRTHNGTALGYVAGQSITGVHDNDHWRKRWRDAEEADVKTASVHLDVFVGAPNMEDPEHQYRGHRMMDRHGMRWNDPLFTTGNVFTPDPLLANYISTEQTMHHWLPPAADVRHDDPAGEPIAGLAGKVAFVGSRYGEGLLHPEYPERAGLLDFLHVMYGTDFYWYGPGSPFGGLRGKQLWDIYASDCVIVGDSCFAQSIEQRPMYWSDRVPETIAHGGLLIHPAVGGIMERFPMLATWYPSDGYDALARQIDMLRDALPMRNVRGQAMALCHRDHTYMNRARQILTTLELA